MPPGKQRPPPRRTGPSDASPTACHVPAQETSSPGTRDKHDELLGGHGSDTLEAGAGKDFIYASHGRNIITTGGGMDQIHAHFGRGPVTYANPKATLFVSHKSEKRYKIENCPRRSLQDLRPLSRTPQGRPAHA